jgi:hypothetical protein
MGYDQPVLALASGLVSFSVARPSSSVATAFSSRDDAPRGTVGRPDRPGQFAGAERRTGQSFIETER